jgi:hypothetical protein
MYSCIRLTSSTLASRQPPMIIQTLVKLWNKSKEV